MKISQYLASLGRSPDQIACSLRRQGMAGKTSSQIIIEALYRNCKPWDGLNVFISHSNGKNYYYLTYDDAQMLDPVLPPVVEEFMRRFDAGEYQELKKDWQ